MCVMRWMNSPDTVCCDKLALKLQPGADKKSKLTLREQGMTGDQLPCWQCKHGGIKLCGCVSVPQMMSRPVAKTLLKGVMALEVLGVLGAYGLYRRMDSSQGTHYTSGHSNIWR